MIRLRSQLPGILRSAMSGRFNRSVASQQWVVCGRLLGFLAYPPARGQAYAVLDEGLIGVGVNPRVDRLVADRTLGSSGGCNGSW